VREKLRVNASAHLRISNNDIAQRAKEDALKKKHHPRVSMARSSRTRKRKTTMMTTNSRARARERERDYYSHSKE